MNTYFRFYYGSLADSVKTHLICNDTEALVKIIEQYRKDCLMRGEYTYKINKGMFNYRCNQLMFSVYLNNNDTYDFKIGNLFIKAEDVINKFVKG